LRRRQNAASEQGCQIVFFDAKFVKFGFFQRQLASKKCVCFFLFNIWVFWRQLASDYRFANSNVLLESVIRLFKTVLGVFFQKLEKKLP